MKRVWLFGGCLALLLERRVRLECIQAGSFAAAHWFLDDLEDGVDLAIVALDLRYGDGGELGERLRQLRSDLPVLVLTADRSLERRTRASEAGADEAFGADTYGEDLVHAIKRLISEGRSSTSRSVSPTNVPNDTRLLCQLSVMLMSCQEGNHQSEVRAEIRVLVAFADEYRSYREVIAAALSLMRTRAEVATSDLDVLGEKLATFDPHLVICSRPPPASSNAVDAWIELSLHLSRPARICIGGHCSQEHNPTVERLLAIFDEVKQLIRNGRGIRGC